MAVVAVLVSTCLQIAICLVYRLFMRVLCVSYCKLKSQCREVSSATATDMKWNRYFRSGLSLLSLLVKCPNYAARRTWWQFIHQNHSFVCVGVSVECLWAYLVSGPVKWYFRIVSAYSSLEPIYIVWKEIISIRLMWNRFLSHQVASFNCIIFVRVRPVVEMGWAAITAYLQREICDISCLPCVR